MTEERRGQPFAAFPVTAAAPCRGWQERREEDMGVKGDPGGGVTSSGPASSGPVPPEAVPPEAVPPGQGPAGIASADPPAPGKTSTAPTGPTGSGASTGTAAPGVAAGTRRRIRTLVATHWIFLIVLLSAIAMRVITMLGFRWALWFNDSYGYVADATGRFKPDTLRPSGYSLILRLLEPTHSFMTAAIIQHLMGLAIGVMVYAVARHRFRVPRPVAALATLPALFDGNQIQLEHLLMADVPFAFLVTVAATIVLWRKRPTTLQFALAGALLGLASVIRDAGLPLLAVLAVYLLVQRVGWRAITAAVLACLAPLGGYMLWFYAAYGKFVITESTGIFMYARVMTFADCSKIQLPPEETALCTTVPPNKRPLGQWYMWGEDTPLLRFPPPKFGPLQNRLAEDFSVRAIEAQPLSYATAVWKDTWRAFGWNRPVFPDRLTYAEYQFGNAINGPSRKAAVGTGSHATTPRRYVDRSTQTQVVQPYADIMVWYQKHIYLPGTVLGVLLAVGLCGMAVGWRRFGGEILLPWGLSAGLLVVPAATAEFDYRYVLPAVPFACLAAAMILARGNPLGDRLHARLDRRSAARAIPDVPREPAAADRVPIPPAGASGPAGRAATGHGSDSPDTGSGAGRSGARKPAGRGANGRESAVSGSEGRGSDGRGSDGRDSAGKGEAGRGGEAGGGSEAAHLPGTPGAPDDSADDGRDGRQSARATRDGSGPVAEADSGSARPSG